MHIYGSLVVEDLLTLGRQVCHHDLSKTQNASDGGRELNSRACSYEYYGDLFLLG